MYVDKKILFQIDIWDVKNFNAFWLAELNVIVEWK